MQALTQVNDNHIQSDRNSFEQGINVLEKQLHTIDEKISSTINKEIQKEIQYERQGILHVQNTLLSRISPLL
ncbi:MAG TPA: hypothetical protein VK111_01840 [Virgibacillus sp.]|nr:hypothetical protein [Virgibacillus sp.]